LAIQDRERRKVQLTGKSSCMVALPKRWVKEMGLRQGSEILITRPTLSTLLITTDHGMITNGKQEAILEVMEKDSAETLFRKIVSLYIHGYSLISLRAAGGTLSSAKRDAIKDMVRRHLIGTEGVAESRDRISVHVLLGYSELSVENALKKMLLITSSMQKDALLALEDDDKSAAEGIIERDDEVDRFGLYVIRQLNVFVSQGIFKENILEPRDLLGYTMVAKIIERVADHTTRIAETVAKLSQPLQPQTVQKLVAMNEVAVSLLDGAMLSLFKRDNAAADQVMDRAKHLMGMEDTLRASIDPKDIKSYYEVHVIVDSIKRIVEYSTDIAEVVLNLTIERIIKKDEQSEIAAPIYNNHMTV
jgi:phosphate uptake regulator